MVAIFQGYHLLKCIIVQKKNIVFTFDAWSNKTKTRKEKLEVLKVPGSNCMNEEYEWKLYKRKLYKVKVYEWKVCE